MTETNGNRIVTWNNLLHPLNAIVTIYFKQVF